MKLISFTRRTILTIVTACFSFFILSAVHAQNRNTNVLPFILPLVLSESETRIITFDTPTEGIQLLFPDGVNSMQVIVEGASGGDVIDRNRVGPGGLGGNSQATIDLPPGEILTIMVGGEGENGGENPNTPGFLNGAGGGGYSAIVNSNGRLLILASGGGGAEGGGLAGGNGTADPTFRNGNGNGNNETGSIGTFGLGAGSFENGGDGGTALGQNNGGAGGRLSRNNGDNGGNANDNGETGAGGGGGGRGSNSTLNNTIGGNGGNGGNGTGTSTFFDFDDLVGGAGGGGGGGFGSQGGLGGSINAGTFLGTVNGTQGGLNGGGGGGAGFSSVGGGGGGGGAGDNSENFVGGGGGGGIGYIDGGLLNARFEFASNDGNGRVILTLPSSVRVQQIGN